MEKKTNVGLTYGLIGGLAMSVFMLLLYLGGTSYFLGPVAWLGYVIIIIIAVLAGLKQRSINGNFLAFSQALKVVFSVFVIAFLIQTIFSYVLLNYIDVSFRDVLAQKTMEKTEEIMKKFGASQDIIDKALEDASKRDNYSIKNMLLGFGVMCIVFFIFSLIIAAIIKRKQSPFENSFNQA